MKHKVAVTVNGHKHEHEVEPRLLLVHYLRDVIGLTGTHVGCDTSQCGACTVHVDGQAVKSCTMFAVQADGREIKTIEGLASADGTLHPIQQAFWMSTVCSAATAPPASSWQPRTFSSRTRARPRTTS